MIGKIIEIITLFDTATFTNKYQVVIEFEKEPKLTLGECEVVQN